jgi:hypothetical protein
MLMQQHAAQDHSRQQRLRLPENSAPLVAHLEAALPQCLTIESGIAAGNAAQKIK